MIMKNLKSGERVMQKIDYFNFTEAPQQIGDMWKSEVSKVIDSGIFIGGSSVRAFEENFADYLGVQFCVGVGNGYDALVIALRAVEIKAGERIAVPSHTFIATWLAISAIGAIPVGIDCDATGQMDLDILETSDQKFAAVLIVHMHGQMVNMVRLTNWAKLNDLKVIEDCAQAHGAVFDGKKAGTWGDVAAFSFYPTKNLGALGDGGAVVTNNSMIAKTTRIIANYGSSLESKYSYELQGINSRLDSIQAAILNVNLQFLDDWNAHRIALANLYSSALDSLGFKMLTKASHSVFHHFVVFSPRRNELRKFLEEKNIRTEIHYPQCAQISHEKTVDSIHKSDFPESAINFASTSLSLPLSQWMPVEKVRLVIDVMQEAKSLGFS